VNRPIEFTIYVTGRCGGRSEAMFYTEFGRHFEYGYDKAEAIRKALKYSGYKTAKIVHVQ
jgi:hypothetical protein